jgi:acyl carrier protein
MASSNDVSDKVNKVLVDALGVEEAAVIPAAALQADLGAESIDFLDIAFRLERVFGIKIPPGELFSERVFELAREIVQNGQVTAQGLAALRSHMPYADLTVLERDRRLNRIDDLLTVDLLTRYVVWKLRRDGEAQSELPRSALPPTSELAQMPVGSAGV